MPLYPIDACWVKGWPRAGSLFKDPHRWPTLLISRYCLCRPVSLFRSGLFLEAPQKKVDGLRAARKDDGPDQTADHTDYVVGLSSHIPWGQGPHNQVSLCGYLRPSPGCLVNWHRRNNLKRTTTTINQAIFKSRAAFRYATWANSACVPKSPLRNAAMNAAPSSSRANG